MMHQVEFLGNIPLHGSVNGSRLSNEVQVGLMVRLLSKSFSVFSFFIFRPEFVLKACILHLDSPLIVMFKFLLSTVSL